MLKLFRASKSNFLVWAILILLIIGLGGWGIGVSGGLSSGEVARVGDSKVAADEYARALDQELRTISSRTGRSLTMTEARQFGVDRMVLARLVNDAALDNEAARLGLSTGDEQVRALIVSTPGFQGIDGSFDRDTYNFALERVGLTPGAFEETLRREATREVIARAVQAPATMPDAAAVTVLDFLGERRGFDWIRLGESELEAPIAEPGDGDLAAFHEANPERYTRPETRQITYAIAAPDRIAAGVEIPDEELRAAYDAAGDRFETPERRILDRIGFRSEEDAETAKARLDAGEIDFDALATERGLSAADIDQGTLAARELDAAARDAVFGASGPGIVGPVETPLGPSLYRVNAILAAETTSFEDARGTLAEERALEEAERRIHEETAVIEDLIAGGASIEEIASETVMEMDTIALNAETTGGVADDPAFRAAAEAATEGEETDLVELEGGGLATLRVDAVEPPALLPLDEVRDRVAADWRADRIAEALTARAEALAGDVGDAGLATVAEPLGLTVQAAQPITRGDVLPGAPPRLVADVFEVEPGGTVIVPDGDGVIVAHLTDVVPFDPDEGNNAAVLADLQAQFDAQVADDVLTAYTTALRDEAGVSLNQDLIEQTLERFP